jgi:hypothetical protein
MDCGHDAHGMMACAMSCCSNSDRPAVASAVFVLPPPVQLKAPAGLSSAVYFLDSLGFLRSIEPLSPPPRLGFYAA